MTPKRLARLEQIARSTREADYRSECPEADRLEECLDEIRRLRTDSDQNAHLMEVAEDQIKKLDMVRHAMSVTIQSMTDEIEVATAWWAEKLRHVARFDNGDDSPTGGLTAIMAMTVSARNPVPTEDQLAEFRISLGERLMVRCISSWRPDSPDWGSYQRCISVDYGADPILAHACADAGIVEPDTRFPCKTTMWVNPRRISVSEGYRAEPVIIYPKDKIEITVGPEGEEMVQRFIEESAHPTSMPTQTLKDAVRVVSRCERCGGRGRCKVHTGPLGELGPCPDCDGSGQKKISEATTE